MNAASCLAVCACDARILFITEIGMVKRVTRGDEEWRDQLTPEQYEVCRRKGTERPFSGAYYDCKEVGIYSCVCCGNELFHSEEKFDSGTGWPSFTQPIQGESVATVTDTSAGMVRTEVICGRCDAHLGHVFPDGPAPSGNRYCMNSASLILDREKAPEEPVDEP
jgi:peptide-methionine (R)-S-oxide reductase